MSLWPESSWPKVAPICMTLFERTKRRDNVVDKGTEKRTLPNVERGNGSDL